MYQRGNHSLVCDPTRQRFIEGYQEMGVVDRVVVLCGVPLERDAAISGSTLNLVEDALRETLGNEQVVPERECSVNSSSGLSCRAHLSIGVGVGVYGSYANDAIGRKYAARTASAVGSDGPRGCVGVIEIVIFCGGGDDIAHDVNWASESNLGARH